MYFNIDHQTMIKEEKENISKDKAVNPRFSGHTHSDASKQKIANSQAKRYQTIREYLRQGMNTLNEDDVKRICKQVVNEYVAKHTTPIKNNNILNIPL